MKHTAFSIRRFANCNRTESRRTVLQLQQVSTATSIVQTQQSEDRVLVESISEAVFCQGQLLDTVQHELRHFTRQSDIIHVKSDIHPNNETSQNTFNSTDVDTLDQTSTSSNGPYTHSAITARFPSSFTFHMVKYRRCNPLCVCLPSTRVPAKPPMDKRCNWLFVSWLYRPATVSQSVQY